MWIGVSVVGLGSIILTIRFYFRSPLIAAARFIYRTLRWESSAVERFVQRLYGDSY